MLARPGELEGESMSETDLKQLVTDEVSEQVEVADLLGDGSIREAIDGGDLGAAVGKSVGEQIGRELGASVGREIHLTIAEGIKQDKSIAEIRSELSSALREALSTGLKRAQLTDSARSLAKLATEESGLEDMLDSEESSAEKTDSDEADTDEEPKTESEQTDRADADKTDSDVSTDQLEALRTETLEDFLGTMSYQDLQSVAKDVGVKANLSREEMTDRIVAELADGKEDSTAQAQAS